MPQDILSLDIEIGVVIKKNTFVDKSWSQYQYQYGDVNNISGQDQYDELKIFYATNYSQCSYRDQYRATKHFRSVAKK